MTTFGDINLPPSLEEGEAAETRAVTLLKAYFAPLSGKNEGFTGGVWDTFDPSRTRAASANTFTADDIVSCSLLSTPIDPRAAVELLDRQRTRYEVFLQHIGPDREFVEMESTGSGSFAPVRQLYRALLTLPGIGETRATKLLARKRPRMVPIIDSVVRKTVFNNAKYQWQPLLDAMQANDKELWNRLGTIREVAGIGEEVSRLRIFDVLAWMEGTDNARRVLEGKAIDASDDPDAVAVEETI